MIQDPKYYQRYELHMKNGEILDYLEDYELPDEDGLIGDFKKGKKKFLEYGNLFCDYTIPFDQISFIVANGVEKVL